MSDEERLQTLNHQRRELETTIILMQTEITGCKENLTLICAEIERLKGKNHGPTHRARDQR